MVRSSRRKAFFALLAVLAILFIVLIAIHNAHKNYDAHVAAIAPIYFQPTPPPPKTALSITISPETTYFTEPLRKDGSVNYAAILDERTRQGVTPENNAAVLFCQAVGPSEIDETLREKYFSRLGIPPLPEKGDYFQPLKEFVAGQKENSPSDAEKTQSGAENDPESLWDIAKTRPWSKEEFPLLASWLAANEKPLALIEECSKRPRFYEPLVGGEKLQVGLLPNPILSYFHLSKDILGAIRTRAMLRLREGNVEGAWKDLMTCHRMARLANQGSICMYNIEANRLEQNACEGDRVLLQYASLIREQIAQIRLDLQQLSPLSLWSDNIDLAERLTHLEIVVEAAREGTAGLATLSSLAKQKDLQKTIHLLIYYAKDTSIDWDVALRLGNAWFDRIAEARQRPTYAEQKESLSKIDQELHEFVNTAADTDSFEKEMLDNPRKTLSERVGRVLLSLFLPESLITSRVSLSERTMMYFELDKLAFALAAYRAEKGLYPEKLDNLIPDYVADVPRDICTGGELYYRTTANGFLLYSAGGNGRDDGGKSYEDRPDRTDPTELEKRGEDWDDITISIPPLPEREKKLSAALHSSQKLSETDVAIRDALAKKIQESVEELNYSIETGREVADMIMEWKDPYDVPLLLVASKKISRARQDCEKNVLPKEEVARIEAESVQELKDRLFFRLRYETNHFDLDEIVQDQKANCLGCMQLFFVIGNALGLPTQGVYTDEMFASSLPLGTSHAANLVHLSDGKVLLVDLAAMKVSDSMVFEEQYCPSGNFWELRDKRNLLGIHPIIQLLDREEIIGCIYNNRAANLIRSGQNERAIALLDKAIGINNDNAMLFFNRGNAYVQVGKNDLALADYSKAIEMNPRYAAAYYARGFCCYTRLKNFDLAILDFSKAIELTPSCAEAYYNRGLTYAELKQYSYALNDLTKAIDINANLAIAYMGRGSIHGFMGNKNEALKDLKRAVELDASLQEAAKILADKHKIPW